MNLIPFLNFCKQSIYCILGTYSLFITASCSKNNNEPAASDCKIALVTFAPTGGLPESASFSYDGGKLKFMAVGNSASEFFYHTNGYTRRSSTGNGWSVHSRVELNPSGQPQVKKDTTYNGQSISATYITTYEYNSQGELSKMFTGNNPQPSASFTWQNGNLVKIVEGNSSFILDYYTDKPNQDFTFMDLRLFVTVGTHLARSKNLLKSMTSGGQQMIFTYEFDEEGKFKKSTANFLGSPDTVMTGSYSYVCN